jgi:hypothetical protein
MCVCVCVCVCAYHTPTTTIYEKTDILEVVMVLRNVHSINNFYYSTLLRPSNQMYNTHMPVLIM